MLLTALLAVVVLAAGIAATVITLHGAGDRIGGILASVLASLVIFVLTALGAAAIRDSPRRR